MIFFDDENSVVIDAAGCCGYGYAVLHEGHFSADRQEVFFLRQDIPQTDSTKKRVFTCFTCD